MVIIMSHPTLIKYHPVHHPRYIDVFEQAVPDTTDGHKIARRYETHFAEDEWYRQLYHTSYAYHGIKPLYMWYWGGHQRIGDVKATCRQGREPILVDQAQRCVGDSLSRKWSARR